MYCTECDNFIFYSVVLDYNKNGAPMDKIILPNYCPVCGHPLEEYKGNIAERMYK